MGSSHAARLIRYFRDCHRADSREFAIANLLGRRVKQRRFLTGREELLDGTLGRLAVDPDWAEKTHGAASVYKREKSLIYGCFMLVGRELRLGGRSSALCAPLLFYPASLQREELAGEPVAWLRVDLGEQRPNVPVLAALLGDAEAAEGAVESLLASLPEPPLDAAAIHELATLLETLLPNVDTSLLYHYPRLVALDEIRRAMKGGEGGTGEGGRPYRVVPAAAVALIDNPPETRGVLYELSALAAEDHMAAPLASLLRSGREVETEPRQVSTGNVPAILSAPQQASLASAASRSLTLVIGPPGTGKSFTVAALAMDHLFRGESVLFASRGNQALDVIGDKLETLLGETGFVIRGGRKQYLRELKEQLARMLRGVLPLAELAGEDPAEAGKGLSRLDRAIERLERKLRQRGAAELALGAALTAGAGEGFVSRLTRPVKRRYYTWSLARARPQWELMAEYQGVLEQRVALLSRLLKIRLRLRLERALEEHRAELKRFLSALRARTSSRQERLFRELDLKVLLKTFPVWMVSLPAVHRVLPLERELFDLAIIDEATQCDAASCLPVLQRARRAVVTGDPKQLRHVSFLGRRRQQLIASRHELSDAERLAFDYRSKSVLDLVEDVVESRHQVVSLDEHYRSRPSIIAFSNREFYAGTLKVMTDYPGSGPDASIQLRRVEGRRLPGGPNREEARALVEEVALWVEREQELDQQLCHSLGILSPLRDQVEHIQELVSGRLSVAAMERHDLRIGTAHAFQGEERDVMFLSFVVDGESDAGTLRYLSRPDVFNVSITRARDLQLVFASLDPEQAPRGSLLARYLAEAAAGVAAAAPHHAPAARARFLEEVRGALERGGFRVWAAFPLAGLSVDLVVEREGRTLGIDLVGHAGPYARAFPLERYRMLHRAGLVVMPLPWSAWQRDRVGTLRAVVAQTLTGARNPAR